MSFTQSRPHARLKVIGCALTVFILAVACYAGYWIRASAKHAGCMRRLQELYSHVLDEDTRTIDGRVNLTVLPRSTLWNRCPGCGEIFEYMPITGTAKTNGETELDTPIKILSWCPQPCHFGHRNVLLETGSVVPIPESYFQRMVDNGYTTTWAQVTEAVQKTRVWF